MALRTVPAGIFAFGLAVALAGGFAPAPVMAQTDQRTPTAASAEPLKPSSVREDNWLGLKLVWCPPGDFLMGSPASEPASASNEEQVQVTLTRGFWIGQTEVTQGQWQKVMETTPWKGQRHVKEGENVAATHITWDAAMAFCRKLSDREQTDKRLGLDERYVLPTEAQWEYACRAGTTTWFSFDDKRDKKVLNAHMWWGGYFGVGNAKDELYAHPVGLLKPNPWGLYDMHGNVLEHCRDFYRDKLPGGVDPEVKESPGVVVRVLRGGFWFSPGVPDFKSARRFKQTFPLTVLEKYSGFRVARCAVTN
jgi:formylglycine-generating enzyme required for sulfatase activity